jgi:hypothetical protein
LGYVAVTPHYFAAFSPGNKAGAIMLEGSTAGFAGRRRELGIGIDYKKQKWKKSSKNSHVSALF